MNYMMKYTARIYCETYSRTYRGWIFIYTNKK